MRFPFFNNQTSATAPPEAKRSRGWGLHFNNLTRASWMDRNYDNFAKEAYQINVIAYSAINRIANAVASIEWQVRTPDGKDHDEHPFLDLLKRPNPAHSGAEWWRIRIGYLLLSGNLYDERVDDSKGRPKELWPLRPDRMTIVKGTSGLPAGFVYKVGQQKISFPANEITGGGPIRHTKLFHPTDDWYGMSPIEAAAYSIDQHNESMSWVQALLQNSARPSGAMIVDAEEPLSDDEFARIKTEIDTFYSGSQNAGRPMLLEGGLDWKQMGMSPMDMEILKTKESAARDVSLAFGVPPLLLNIPGDNTYANYREARLGFYEDTILPFLEYQVAEINDWLGSAFGGAILRPNKDKIEAIADKRQKQWEMADSSDDITLNESRRMKGLPPLPAPLGDTLMLELRAQTKGRKDPQAEAEAEELIKEAAYGPS